jgi:glycosyltransferase involved in cell wall biosynthesis
MKLVIDLQGAQSASRHRGIGRYSLALAKAMAQSAGDHEIWFALSSAFPDTIEPLRRTFDGLVPQDHIVVWDALVPVSHLYSSNRWRRKTSEILREAFLASLNPDMVHVSSLFEGYGDDAITSVGAYENGSHVGVTLYDLIPLIHKGDFLKTPQQNEWYQQKLTSLRRAGLWLAISDASRRAGIEFLDLPSEQIVNISAAADPMFRPLQIGESEARAIHEKYGLYQRFVLYTGAIDPHKNLSRLLSGYAQLDPVIRQSYQLLIVSPADANDIAPLLRQARGLGFSENQVVFAPFVPDNDLVALYNLCAAYCIPSLYEGFGLPALEAMQCGAPTIGSNLSSVPEVIGHADALFDPYDDRDIASRLHQVLSDESYRNSLVAHGLEQARKFSWQESARRAWSAFEAAHERRQRVERPSQHRSSRFKPRLAYVPSISPPMDVVDNVSFKLLPELARHYDIEVVSDHAELKDPWVVSNCPIRSLSWFIQNANRYSRILYQFRGVGLDSRLPELLKWHPGVVMIDALVFENFVACPAAGNAMSDVGVQEIYRSRGYAEFVKKGKIEEFDKVDVSLAAVLSLLGNAKGIIFDDCEIDSLEQRLTGSRFTTNSAVIPVRNPQSIRARADKVFDAIERFSLEFPAALEAEVLELLAAVEPDYPNETDWVALARAVSRNLPTETSDRQLLIDISELVTRDARTGIQRVTRSVLTELLLNPPKGYRIEPVYASATRKGYRYARKFTLRFLGFPSSLLNDAEVDARPGDVFLGLDLQHHVVLSQREAYADMRRRGVKIYFVVYDLLPINLPHAFADGSADMHARWLLELNRHADGIACISRAVAHELEEWLRQQMPEISRRPLKIGWFHLGADIEMSAPTGGLPDDADHVLNLMASNPTFVLVGTIEPRKGHAQTLAAFERLWDAGANVALAIVGKQGWKVASLIERLRGHPELGRRLFWLEGASDEYLEKIYSASTCLIAASEGEGFGLPLIEAARHEIPILARDISVFREVAGRHASYFSGNDPDDLAAAVTEWLKLYAAKGHPRSANIPWLTWSDSVEQLMAVVLEKPSKISMP